MINADIPKHVKASGVATRGQAPSTLDDAGRFVEKADSHPVGVLALVMERERNRAREAAQRYKVLQQPVGSGPSPSRSTGRASRAAQRRRP